MKSTKAASRYAKALLELAIEQNKVEAVAADLNYLSEVNAETKEFAILLKSPVINSAKKIAIFNELFGQFEEMTTSFIKLITNNRREYMLAQIAASFDAQLKAHKGIVPITIVSATALNSDTRQMIVNKIQETVKGELEIEEIIDESLIGGFIVQMDDKQIDASVASQLSNLKQRLTR
jgi:F-type H+-transporting ATPase subunit delta